MGQWVLRMVKFDVRFPLGMVEASMSGEGGRSIWPTPHQMAQKVVENNKKQQETRETRATKR